MMGRMVADCRRWPSESNCSLTIIGERDEVVRAAAEHAASVHGHEDSPEMRKQIEELLETDESYRPGTREPEAAAPSAERPRYPCRTLRNGAGWTAPRAP